VTLAVCHCYVFSAVDGKSVIFNVKIFFCLY